MQEFIKKHPEFCALSLLTFLCAFFFPKKFFLTFSQKKTLVEQTSKPSLIVFDPTSYNKLSSPSEWKASA